MKVKCKIFIAAILSCGVLSIVKAQNDDIKISKPPVIMDDTYDIEDNPIFATFDNGNIYIVDDPDKVDEEDNDIVIIDERDTRENMRIEDSYRLDNPLTQLKIINIILKYNELHPSKKEWIRTKYSLLNEWIAHNIAYFWDYEKERTESVDFENREEDTYNILKLTKKD